MKFLLVTFVLCIIHCVASQSRLEHRVIGGRPARANEFPFLVSFQVANLPYCGGSLITDTYILTAASCGGWYPDVPIKTAVAGGHIFDISNPRPGPRVQSRSISSFINYANYANDHGLNNIAIAKASSPFSLNRWVTPVPVAPIGFTIDQNVVKAFIAGWGSTSKGGAVLRRITLQKAYVPIHSRPSCEFAWSAAQFGSTDICAGALRGTPSACGGDIGGPLALESSRGSHVLVGVLRYTESPCGIAAKPDVFVDVSNQQISEWISSVVRPLPATTVAPSTTAAPTTTVAPTTTAAVTTTVAPTTTAAVTTTVAPTTTAAVTTTVAPTTTAAAPST